MAMVNTFRVDAGDSVTVTVHRRSDSKSRNWHVHIKFPKLKPVRKSLETEDRSKAKRVALRLAHNLQDKLEQGHSIHTLSFNKVANMLVEHIKHESEIEPDPKRKATLTRKANDYAGTLNRWYKKYFNDKSINNISALEIAEYKRWRKDYWVTGEGSETESISYTRNGKTIVRPHRKKKPPAKTTLKREESILSAVFSYAVERGFINKSEIPTFKKEKAEQNRRPAFTEEELELLLTTVIPRRIIRAPDSRIKRTRQLLAYFIKIMLNTGLRPGEARNLKWKDIDWPADDDSADRVIILHVAGKTGKREVVTLPGTNKELTNLAKLQTEWHEEHNLREIMANDYVFCDEYGRHTQSFSKSFENLLNSDNLLYDKVTGDKRTIYSLRHSYATNGLHAGISVYDLAKNMGTSVTMIEKHYGHTLGAKTHAQLRKTIKKH